MPVEVRVVWSVTGDGMQQLFNAEAPLRKLAIFDTGYGGGERDWEFDFSLRATRDDCAVRIEASGLLGRLLKWTAWLVEHPHDPVARSYVRTLQALVEQREPVDDREWRRWMQLRTPAETKADHERQLDDSQDRFIPVGEDDADPAMWLHNDCGEE